MKGTPIITFPLREGAKSLGVNDADISFSKGAKLTSFRSCVRSFFLGNFHEENLRIYETLVNNVTFFTSIVGNQTVIDKKYYLVDLLVFRSKDD